MEMNNHNSSSSSSSSTSNSKKKRTKFLNNSISIPKPKAKTKPDPSAPKITRPCTECGKKFWSWKALFGHMRCHPERKWRGINPPPNFRRSKDEEEEDDDEYEVAASLLLLANGPPKSSAHFECSSCNKVFASHQALGGHRATHKNVKGCYAITSHPSTDDHDIHGEEDTGCCSHTMMMEDHIQAAGHKCSICCRVFSSGQALGGHMRCHWPHDKQQQVVHPSRVSSAFDLNLVPHLQPNLDLRLGL